MKHRDWVKRKVRYGDDICEWIRIERQICKTCGRLVRILPDFVMPYKQYSRDVVDDILAGAQDDYEDGPCDMTVKRWKSQHKQTP